MIPCPIVHENMNCSTVDMTCDRRRPLTSTDTIEYLNSLLTVLKVNLQTKDEVYPSCTVGTWNELCLQG